MFRCLFREPSFEALLGRPQTSGLGQFLSWSSSFFHSNSEFNFSIDDWTEAPSAPMGLKYFKSFHCDSNWSPLNNFLLIWLIETWTMDMNYILRELNMVIETSLLFQKFSKTLRYNLFYFMRTSIPLLKSFRNCSQKFYCMNYLFVQVLVRWPRLSPANHH